MFILFDEFQTDYHVSTETPIQNILALFQVRARKSKMADCEIIKS